MISSGAIQSFLLLIESLALFTLLDGTLYSNSCEENVAKNSQQTSPSL